MILQEFSDFIALNHFLSLCKEEHRKALYVSKDQTLHFCVFLERNTS